MAPSSGRIGSVIANASCGSKCVGDELAGQAEGDPERVALEAEIGRVAAGAGIDVIEHAATGIDDRDAIADAAGGEEAVADEDHAVGIEAVIEPAPSPGLADPVAEPGELHDAVLHGQPDQERAVGMEG